MSLLLKNYQQDITFHLKNQDFDGPLDLLLTLIDNAKINIQSIFVSEITNQYLSYVKELDNPDFEYCADFLLMASTLLELKSRSMLPTLTVQEEFEIVETQETIFRQLEEYRKFRDIALSLRPLETLNRFYREPEYDENEFRLVFKSFNIDKLVEAFSLLLEKIEFSEQEAEPKTILKERFTVAEKVSYLIILIRDKKELYFFDLFDKDYSKLEIINTFLAILEVLKQQVASAEQNNLGGNIIIRYCEATDNLDDKKLKELDEYAKEYN